MNSSEKNEVDVFTQNNLHRFLVDNGGKILISVVAAIYLIIIILWPEKVNIVRLHNVIIVMISAFIVVHLLLKRFIRELKIDHKNSELIIKLYRSKKLISAKGGEVSFRKLLGYLLLSVKSKKFIYNGIINDQLITALNRFIESAAPNHRV
jgi:hypothetical protein